MISVIIPTYKEPEYLDLCLHSAFKGQVNKNEIIVVVDGFMELNKPILDKYPDVVILDLGTNQGLSVATNWGVYNATHEFILVVNDDNVFPENWDTSIEPYLGKGIVVSPNQVEPAPSMFKQFEIEDLGKEPSEFNLEEFWDYARSITLEQADGTGSTLPFAMYKYDYLAVGGWDIMYPSPHVVDWDFFLKCEYAGYRMDRIYTSHFYHFAGAATRKTPEQNAQSTAKEQQAHLFFTNKWDGYAEHNPSTNSKLLNKFNYGKDQS
jgi:glycosyltransferase involved in cell wall biosynthesis